MAAETMNVILGKNSILLDEVCIGETYILDVFMRKRFKDAVTYYVDKTTTTVVTECKEEGPFKIFKTMDTTYVAVDDLDCRDVHYGLVDTVPVSGEEVTIQELTEGFCCTQIVEKNITAKTVGDAYEEYGVFVIYDDEDIYLLYQRGKI